MFFITCFIDFLIKHLTHVVDCKSFATALDSCSFMVWLSTILNSSRFCLVIIRVAFSTPNITIQLPKYKIDYLITEGTLSANPEAIGEISIL